MKRRDFIIKTTAGSAGLALATPLVSQGAIPANSKVNLAIIGSGSRGMGLAMLVKEVPHLNLVALCDTLPFRLTAGLAKAAKVYPKVKGYKDYRAVLAHPDVDAVLIATPLSTHADIACDALEAGKHVYCEKTMAKGYAGIKRVVQKAKNAKTVFQTGHQYHSSRMYTQVVAMIKAGKLGKITALDCQWNRNNDWRRNVPEPSLERLVNWRLYKEFSNGQLSELSSHQLDFTNWVLDAVPTKVMGIGGNDYWKDGREIFDNIHLIYDYPNGVRAKFTCLSSNAKDDYKIRVSGDKGTMVLDYRKAWFYPEKGYETTLGEVDGVSGATISGGPHKVVTLNLDHADPSLQALQDFTESILQSKPPTSDVLTGAKAAICVQMGWEAMCKQEIVGWNADPLS